jgi:hypothetical protein
MPADCNPELLARPSWHGQQVFIQGPVPGNDEKSDEVVTDSRNKLINATPIVYIHTKALLAESRFLDRWRLSKERQCGANRWAFAIAND